MKEYIKNLESALRKILIFNKNKRYLAENIVYTSEKQALIISGFILVTPVLIIIITKALA